MQLQYSYCDHCIAQYRLAPGVLPNSPRLRGVRLPPFHATLHKKDELGTIEEQLPWVRIKWTSRRMIGWSVEPTNL